MKNTKNNISYKMQMGGEQDAILSFLVQYAQTKGVNPEELIADFQKATPEQQQEFLAQIQETQPMKFGGIPKSENGVFDYPNQPVIVPTRGTGNISMKGVKNPLQAFNANTMEYLGYMNPEQEYNFDADEILEVPVAQYGGRSTSYYDNYIDKFSNELSELEILKSNKQAGYLNAGQAKRLTELENKHLKFNKDFNKAFKSKASNVSKSSEFTPEEEKEFNELLKKERSDKRKLTITENKKLAQLKAEQEKLDALKPLAEKPIRKKRNFATGTIQQIREENAKFLKESKKRDAKLESLGFDFSPKQKTTQPFSMVKPSVSPTTTTVLPDDDFVANQGKIQSRNENIRILSEKLKDPKLNKAQKDALFSQLQKLTKENTILPKTNQSGFKKGIIDVGEGVIDFAESLGRNKWLNRASDVLGTIGGVAGGALAALDLINTAEEGRGSVGALEFLNDNSPLGKKYQKEYEKQLNEKGIYKADEINRDLGNAYYEERKAQQPSYIPKVDTSQYSGYIPDSTIQYSGNTYTETPKSKSNIKPRSSNNDNFITGLKGFTTGEQMTPVYKDSWVEEWSAIDPDFKKKSFAQQQAFAQDWTKKNAPDYYKGIGNTFKGYDIDKMTSDKKFGSITNQLRPSLAKGNTTGTEEALPIVEDFNPVVTPKQQFTKEQLDSVDSQYTPLVGEETTQSLKNLPAEMLELGTLKNEDYFSPYLSNAKRRANRVMSPYFKDVNLTTPQLYQEDVSPYLANITRQVRGAAQNINPNSTVGQSVAQQIASNAAFQANTIQGQVANRNLERQNAWQNQVLGIQNQQAMLDDANRAQYVDDWARTLTNKDNIENLIDMQASTFKMQRQKEANEMALLDATLNNIDFRKNSDGSNTIMQKKTTDFKNPWESLSDAQVMSQFMKKDTKTAKFGLKKKAPY